MTQEELDALMSGDPAELDDLEVEDTSSESGSIEEEIVVEESEIDDDVSDDHYRASAINSMPPPPTDDNKMVHQLDDVTKESEEKASEIFDLIEGVSNDIMDAESSLEEVQEILESNIKLFETLSTKFPSITSFQDALEKNKAALETTQKHIETAQNNGDAIMNVMDIMQYQDIHRQKIERVINVMRALSKYMNTLFSGKVDDKNRVASAVHLPGDESTDDVVNEDDIEALLASFGKN